jgi:alpha-amylase
MLLELIGKFPNIRITFSISGVALEQLKKYAPEVVETFRLLAATGAVELLGETYYHSLSSLSDPDLFAREVEQHRSAIKETFDVRPLVFRNTELIYSDEIGRMVQALGFMGVYADGVEALLQTRSSGHLYEHADGNGLKVMTRNYSLSDDIAFRFSNKQWTEWPLTAEKFTRWLHTDTSELTNIGLDYETFGEHQKASTGIFIFLKKVLSIVSHKKEIRMITPSEAMTKLEPQGRISSPMPVSWADKERDISAWLGNHLQRDAYDNLKLTGLQILRLDDRSLFTSWQYLQTSDHFYYMSTKKGDDGQVHSYFSPYPSPYEAFINYMNVLSDIACRVKRVRNSRARGKNRIFSTRSDERTVA